LAGQSEVGQGASGGTSVLERIRGNHALEHATVHLMVRRHPNLKVVGRTTPAGFYLHGPEDSALVEESARAALNALLAEPDLAVHQRCGTNLAVTGVLAGLAAFAAGGGRARGRMAALPQVLLASLWAVMLAQPLGMLVQKHLTTSPRVGAASIGPIERRGGKPATHFVPVNWV